VEYDTGMAVLKMDTRFYELCKKEQTFLPFQNVVHVYIFLQLERNLFLYCDVGSLLVLFIILTKQ